MKPPLPLDETVRLASLGQYDILDTPPEPQFDDLTFLAAQICQVPTAMVSLIDEKRQWFKSTVGVSIAETSRDSAFCAYTILEPDKVMEVFDAQVDPRFADNPFVLSDPHIRFYTGAPLLAADGQPIGTLCVMDRKPRLLSRDQVNALRALSRAVVAQLELRKQAKEIAREKKQANQLLGVAEKSRRALLSVLEDEKQASRNLRASEERFRQLIENSSDVIVVIDKEGLIGYQSPSAQRILGYDPQEMVGKSVYDIVHADDREKTREGIQHALAQTDDPKTIEYRIKHRDGGWRTFQSMGKGMVDSTGNLKVVVNSRDVTESRLLEEKFLRAQRMEAVGTLASGVAHDLNNILTPMLMVAGLLKETLVDKRERDMLTMVEKSAQRGAGIISQLLTFSRGIEGARVSIHPRHLVGEIVSLVQETFPRNIQFKREIAEDLWNIVVDTTQLHQVLLNLCVNARDAMPDGGTLTLGARNIVMSEKDVLPHAEAKTGGYILFTVSDTGHGIPHEIIDRIFDPFFTTKEMGKGTGLGLSTVIGIVKGHKGFVTVYSEPDKGTAFHIYLPAVEGSIRTERVSSTPPISVGNGELILLVDDEPHILDAARELLQSHRYRVLTANNGEEAIRVFIEHRDALQLVVTDMMMPVMGGLALIHTLRVLKPDIKVIATTGLERQEKTTELAALGITVTLAKPFSPSVLLKALDDVLTG